MFRIVLFLLGAMIQAIIILFYIGLAAYGIHRLPLFTINGLSKRFILFLFLLKICAGLMYVYFSTHIIKAGDITMYYSDSQLIYAHWRHGDILTFLQLSTGLNNVLVTENIASTVDSMGFWRDTSAYMVVRFNALVNVLTLGSGIYANTVFFAYTSFLGSFLFAKVLAKKLQAKTSVLLAVFLTPSVWYWTAGSHKESLCVALVACILYSLLHLIHIKKVTAIILALASFVLLFYTRFFIAAMLIPSLMAYYIYHMKRTWHPLLVFASVFIAIGGLSYLTPKILGIPNLVDAVVAEKQLYEALDNGNTAIDLGVYEESYFGIIVNVPKALFNAIVRPHFLDIHSPLLGLASLESLLITILFVTALFYVKNCSWDQQAMVFLLFTFGITYLLLTGLIVPNLGAILRYRSVALFFLVPCLVYLWTRKDDLVS